MNFVDRVLVRLDKMNEWSLKMLVIYGIGFWIVLLSFLVWNTITTDDEPVMNQEVIGYTFHGHPVTVEDLDNEEE